MLYLDVKGFSVNLNNLEEPLTGDMAQRVKYMQHKPHDLSSIPRIHIEKPDAAVYICNTRIPTWRWEGEPEARLGQLQGRGANF